MPIIRVELFKGRTPEQKRAFVKEVTEVFLRTCGGRQEAVQVVFVDVDKADWGAGGVLHADKS